MIFSKLDTPFKDFIKKDRFIAINFFIAIAINLINWILIYYRFTRFLAGQDEQIILHYNIYFGIDSIGSWQTIYYLPLIGLIISIINFLVAYFIYSRDKLLSYFMVGISMFAQIILILSTFFIILVNQY